MEHGDIRHKLSEYIDGSITAEEKTAVEEHLRACRECNNALRELQKTIEHIKTVEEVDAPAWMTQKIMAKVLTKAEEKRRLSRRLILPQSIKIPIQTVAVLFLAVGAIYIYRSIQSAYWPSEAPVKVLQARKDAPPAASAGSEKEMTKDASRSAKRVPQFPEYKALDMKPEYEKPASPTPEGQATAPVPAPEKPAEQPMVAKKESSLERAPKAGAPVMMQERAAPSAGATPQADAKGNTPASITEARRSLEKVVFERHSNGKPKLIVTYDVIDSRKVKLSEERFNAKGERHGIQKEYYGSGQIKTEAQYGYGKLEWYAEFYPDGGKKIGKSDHDWFWLKN